MDKYALALHFHRMNRWDITAWLEQAVTRRDKFCVYCGVTFGSSNDCAGNRPSWEHIVNDARIVTKENISLCCRPAIPARAQNRWGCGWSPHIANDAVLTGKPSQKWSSRRLSSKTLYPHISDTTHLRFLTDL
jgi:ribosomal protein S27AE